MFKKAIAGVGIALLAFFATPLAANADTGDYVPSSQISVSDTTPQPGETVVVTFNDAFLPGEQVSFAVTGEGTATLSMVKAATVTITKTAAADGTAVVNVTLPANATGTYTVTATGLQSGIIGTAAITVVPADAPGGGAGLPVTGAEIPSALLWVAGGTLLLGLVLVVAVTVRRRSLNS